jgi:hypothetical protein
MGKLMMSRVRGIPPIYTQVDFRNDSWTNDTTFQQSSKKTTAILGQ